MSTGTSTPLEIGYRKVLRLLPKPYRAEHAEEMLSVLMDGAKPGQARPKAREVLSVATLALQLRFAAVAAVADAGRSSTLAGDAVRRAVLAFLLYYFGLQVQWNAYGARIGYSFLPLVLQAAVIATLILGWARCGQAACLAYVVYIVHNVQRQYWTFDGIWWYGELTVIAPLLALAAAMVVFRRGASRITGRRWWFLAASAITVAFWIRGKTVDHMRGFDISHTPAMSALLYVAAVVIALRHAKSSPVWPTALLVAGLPEAMTWPTGYLRFHALADSTRNAVYLDLVIGAECLLMGIALASLAFALHRRRTVVSP
jgi:hypothetical protein